MNAKVLLITPVLALLSVSAVPSDVRAQGYERSWHDMTPSERAYYREMRREREMRRAEREIRREERMRREMRMARENERLARENDALRRQRAAVPLIRIPGGPAIVIDD